MIQIYTGMGKGKTTAALGLAFRALGHRKRVLMIQFLKKGKDFGEIKAARRFKRFKIVQAGRNGWVKKGSFSLKDKQYAQKGWNVAQKAIENQKYDLIILDELNVALNFRLLPLQQIKKALTKRPQNTEIVITGRYTHPAILKIADLVSEIKAVKHYYKKGVVCRAGVEY